MTKSLLPTLLSSILAFSCTFTQSDSSDSGPERRAADLQAVQALLEDIISADNAGDLAGVMATYAEDAILLPPNGPIVKGKSEIEKRYQQIFSSSKLELQNRTLETQIAGDWAYCRGLTMGQASPVAGGAPTEIHDKYIMIVRKQLDGSWKIARLMWSKNTKG